MNTYSMKVPQEISNRVISLFLEGKSKAEIVKLSRLSEDQVDNVLSGLDSPEYQKTVIYLLAVKYGKDARDMKEYADILIAIKTLAQHGVLLNDSVRFITNVAGFLKTTHLDSDMLVSTLNVYHKFTRSMDIKTYQELQRRKVQLLYSLQSLWDDERELKARYELLAKGSVRKDH